MWKRGANRLMRRAGQAVGDACRVAAVACAVLVLAASGPRDSAAGAGATGPVVVVRAESQSGDTAAQLPVAEELPQGHEAADDAEAVRLSGIVQGLDGTCGFLYSEDFTRVYETCYGQRAVEVKLPPVGADVPASAHVDFGPLAAAQSTATRCVYRGGPSEAGTHRVQSAVVQYRCCRGERVALLDAADGGNGRSNAARLGSALLNEAVRAPHGTYLRSVDVNITSRSKTFVFDMCSTHVCVLDDLDEFGRPLYDVALDVAAAGADPWRIPEVSDLKGEISLEPESSGGDASLGKPTGAHPREADVVSQAEREQLAQETRELFIHAFDSYMQHAFPHDELRPVTCSGEDFGPTAGNMLTLIDSLDTLAVMGNYSAFADGVNRVAALHRGFDIDTTVSVFETTIRIIGGLLSAHLLATDAEIYPETYVPGYNGRLLELAQEIGDRLLPAFDTKTQIPYGTVNLRHGVPKGETPIASLAGAGSLSLEFQLLSEVTGDPKYGRAARRAVAQLFRRRHETTGLLGKHINVTSGAWTEVNSGVGSNSDSFYEYLVKYYVAFDDPTMWDMWAATSGSLRRYARRGPWHGDVDMRTGALIASVADGLAAFWPGAQVAAGGVAQASWAGNAFHRVWREAGYFPEAWDFSNWAIPPGKGKAAYLLRPELVESTSELFAATRDSTWMAAGRRVLRSLQRAPVQECGVAALDSIRDLSLRDHMPSFFTGETLKYLYLLFAGPPEWLVRTPHVFTTEAHVIPVQRWELGETVSGVNIGGKRAAARALGHALRQTGKTVEAAITNQTERRAMAVLRRLELRERRRNKRAAEPEGFDVNGFPLCFEDAGKRDASRICPIEPWWLVMPCDATVPLESFPMEWTPPAAMPSAAEKLTAELLQRVADENAPGSQTTKIQLPDPLGSFEVQVRGDSFFVRRESTGHELEVANLESRQRLAVSTAGGFTRVAAVNNHGLMGRCMLTATGNFGRNEAGDAAVGFPAPDVYATEDGSLVGDFGPGKGIDRVQRMPCTPAGFGPAQSSTFPVRSRVVIAEPIDACSALQPPRGAHHASAYDGAIVVVQRGECMFQDKVQRATCAGAAAVVVVNSAPGQVFMVMSGREDAGEPDYVELYKDRTAAARLAAVCSEVDMAAAPGVAERVEDGAGNVLVPAVMVSASAGADLRLVGQHGGRAALDFLPGWSGVARADDAVADSKVQAATAVAHQMDAYGSPVVVEVHAPVDEGWSAVTVKPGEQGWQLFILRSWRRVADIALSKQRAMRRRCIWDPMAELRLQCPRPPFGLVAPEEGC